MKLSNCRKDYYEFTAKASDVSRKLAFAGIALIWVFKEDHLNKVPSPLLFPALLFVVALALDLLQYAYGAAVWGFRARCEEKKLRDRSQDPEFSVSPFWNWPTDGCFWGKIGLVVWAYGLAIKYLVTISWT